MIAELKDIVQWLTRRGEKTFKIKLDRETRHWGIHWGIFCTLDQNNPIRFEAHVDEVVMQDVTLKVANHYSGVCGVVGFADGKPVVPGQRVPDRALAEPLVYDKHGKFFIGKNASERSVTSLKFMWLLPNGKALGIQ